MEWTLETGVNRLSVFHGSMLQLPRQSWQQQAIYNVDFHWCNCDRVKFKLFYSDYDDVGMNA